MAEKTTFRLIPRDNNKIITYSGGAAAAEVAVYLLGRRVSAYMIIKSDSRGDRLVDVSATHGFFNELETALYNA